MSAEYPQLGKVIRQKRKEQNLTLQELASQCGLSLGFLSQVENGQTLPSLSSLRKIAQGLGTSLFGLLACGGQRYSTVVRPGDRKIVKWPQLNVAFELLSGNHGPVNLEAAMTHLPPGAHSCDQPLAHGYGPAEEFTYVITGRIKLFLGDEAFELAEGDSVHFNSLVPHKYANEGDQEAVMLTVMSPPSF
ncbi:MAG: XRE family transcriptional regulator [Bacillota bacterium]|nr:XRE family transcriptional regulator [Bacillota bacterium]